MFDDEPENSAESAYDPATRAKDKSDECRMHAELAAVFEGVRKFDASLIPGLSVDISRDVQRTMAKLEKSKIANTPVIPDESAAEAARILALPAAADLSTNDYHIHRRPGEAMIVRWLAGEQVDTFYKRLQAHFDAGIEGFKEDERQALEWKQDEKTLAYLKALDEVKVSMEERYLRDPIRKLNLFVLSTQTADEINIAYLSDQVMGITAADLVGPRSAPPDAPTERDLAWFYKLFSLRGMDKGTERMCFFMFLQKTGDEFGGEE